MRRTRARRPAPSRAPVTLERLRAAIIAMAPLHFYESAMAVLSGGNITSVPNQGTAGGQLNPTGTIPVAASTAFRGYAVATLGGTQHLASSLAASAFKFMHDGLGCDSFTVASTTNVTAGQLVVNTIDSGTTPGAVLVTLPGAARADANIYNSGGLAGTKTGGPGATANNVPFVVRTEVFSTLQVTVGRGTPTAAAAMTSPANVNGARTLNIGRAALGGVYLTGAWAFTFATDRALTPSEVATLYAFAGMIGA